MNETQPIDRALLDQRAWVTNGTLRVRSVADRALIGVLSISHHRQLSAAAMVTQLAAEFPGEHGRRLIRFASEMSAGSPLADALQNTRGVLDPTIVLALRLASQTGTLPEMYAALLGGGEVDGVDATDGGSSTASEFVRIAAQLLFAMFLITFLMLFVVPTFEVMFEEFGMSLPAPTVLLIAACNWFAGYWFLLAAPVFLVLGLVVARWAVLYGDSLSSRLSPWKWGTRRCSSGVNLLSLLAMVAQSGQPIATGLSTLAQYHQVPRIRRRLKRACERIDRGETPWKTLAAEKVISVREASALSVAQSGQTQAWLLGWAAETRLKWSLIRSHLLVRMVSLCCTLVLAFIVAWTAIAIFMALYSLVSGLS